MRTRHPLPSLVSLVIGVALLAGLAIPVAAKERAGHGAPDWGIAGPGSSGEKPGRGARELIVVHGPVSVTLADEASDGHQLGDLRVTSVATTDETGQPLGHLDATLTTTAIDSPGPGDEIRISTLVFSFGETGEDQVVVGGSAAYPAQGSTIAQGAITTRPILGGSGRFAGATGSAITEHLEDDTWRHTIVFDHPVGKPRGSLLERGLKAFAREALHDRFAGPRAERRPAHADKHGAEATSGGSDGAAASGPSTSAATETGITRTSLGSALPGSAPGEELGLWHYTIPAGSKLAAHTHAGWQVARISRGELEYSVIAGEGTLIHEDGSTEQIGPGTYTLHTGDSVVENPDLQHFGANLTDGDVEILAATLYTEGAPASIPLE